MKIVETFPFSEAYEKEIMLLKFQLSNDKIDHWIICENAYTFQGDYKGLLAKDIINADERFKPYKEKIFVIEQSRLFHVIDKSKPTQDSLAFECENWQRELSRIFFMKNFSDNDWLILNDVDEMVDFTDNRRSRELFLNIQKNVEGKLCIPMLRYWYDFDNKYERMYSSVLVQKKYLLKNEKITFSDLRKANRLAYLSKGWKNIIAFEYSSCFKVDDIMRKYDSCSHTGLNREDLIQSLKCNHRSIPLSIIHYYLKPTRSFFFRKVLLTTDNSPKLIRDNLPSYKTNVIDPDYINNRRIYYPWFYTFRYIFFISKVDLVKVKTRIAKRFCKHLMRKLFNFLRIIIPTK